VEGDIVATPCFAISWRRTNVADVQNLVAEELEPVRDDEEISDGRVLRLIRSFLEAGVIVDGAWEPTKTGVPQGGVAGPLWSNIYLTPFDHSFPASRFPMWTPLWRRGRIDAGREIESKAESDELAHFKLIELQDPRITSGSQMCASRHLGADTGHRHWLTRLPRRRGRATEAGR
jgi:hypothetical protein